VLPALGAWGFVSCATLAPPEPEWRAPPGPEEIAFVVTQGYAVVEARAERPGNETLDLRLVIDSGWGCGLGLDDSLESALELEPHGLYVGRGLKRRDGGSGGIGETVFVRERALPRLIFASGLAVRKVPTVHVAFPQWLREKGLSGVVGLSCFQGRAVLLDIPHSRLRLLRDEDVATIVSGDACVELAAEYDNPWSVPYVQALIGPPTTVHEPTRVEIDSGSDGSCIEGSCVLKLGGTTIGTETTFQLPIRLGDVTLTHTFLLQDEPPRLGMDFLLALNRPVLFDPKRKRVVFLP
jgi:hypothetical protein